MCIRDSGDSGHASEKEFMAMKPAYMTTNAYLFKKDRKFVFTFASYDEETFSDRNLIPMGLILSMKKKYLFWLLQVKVSKTLVRRKNYKILSKEL